MEQKRINKNAFVGFPIMIKRGTRVCGDFCERANTRDVIFEKKKKRILIRF